MEKSRTFTCIDHSAPKGEIKMSADLGPVLDVLRGIERALSGINPKISVESPIIDVNVPAPQITVNVPEQKTPQVTVAVPEIVPQITVAPAEVVFQAPENGEKSVYIAPQQNDFEFYAKALVFIALSIPVIMAVELVLKLMGKFN